MGINETDNTVAIYDAETGDLARVLGATTDARSLAYSSDGTLFAWDNPALEIVTLTDISSAVPSTLHEIESGTGAIHRLDFSSDDRWLAGGSDDGSQFVWDVESGLADYAFTDPIVSAVTDLEFSPGADMLAAVGADGEFVVREMATGSVVLEGEGITRSFVWMPDGSVLITLDDSGVATVWGVAE